MKVLVVLLDHGAYTLMTPLAIAAMVENQRGQAVGELNQLAVDWTHAQLIDGNAEMVHQTPPIPYQFPYIMRENWAELILQANHSADDPRIIDCLLLAGGPIVLADNELGGHFPDGADPGAVVDSTTLQPLVLAENGKIAMRGIAPLLASEFRKVSAKGVDGQSLFSFTTFSTFSHLIQHRPEALSSYLGATFKGLWMCDTSSLKHHPATTPLIRFDTAEAELSRFIDVELVTKKRMNVFPSQQMSTMFNNWTELKRYLTTSVVWSRSVHVTMATTWREVFEEAVTHLSSYQMTLAAGDPAKNAYWTSSLLANGLVCKLSRGFGSGHGTVFLRFVPEEAERSAVDSYLDGSYTVTVKDVFGVVIEVAPGHAAESVYDVEPFMQSHYDHVHRLVMSCRKNGNTDGQQLYYVTRRRAPDGTTSLSAPVVLLAKSGDAGKRNRVTLTPGDTVPERELASALSCLVYSAIARIEVAEPHVKWYSNGQIDHLLLSFDMVYSEQLGRLQLTRIRTTTTSDTFLRDMDFRAQQFCVEEMAYAISRFYDSRLGNWPA